MEELSLKLKHRRGGRGVREVAAEIGISHMTLSRVESGKQPDLKTFKLICSWLNIDPSTAMGITQSTGIPQGDDQPLFAHFRASKTMGTDTAHQLANLILAVQKTTKEG